MLGNICLFEQIFYGKRSLGATASSYGLSWRTKFTKPLDRFIGMDNIHSKGEGFEMFNMCPKKIALLSSFFSLIFYQFAKYWQFSENVCARYHVTNGLYKKWY